MKRRTISATLTTLLLVGTMPNEGRSQEIRRTVLEFVPETVAAWFVVNDGVMGGVSSSRLRHLQGDVAVFEGELSLDNNGGFASIRTPIPQGALARAAGIVLRVRGDGKRYQLRLRQDGSWDGVAYAAAFETIPGEWATVEIPLTAFEPTFRGFRPRNVRPLDPERVRQVGLMLTDKQVGAFRLEISTIGVLLTPS